MKNYQSMLKECIQFKALFTLKIFFSFHILYTVWNVSKIFVLESILCWNSFVGIVNKHLFKKIKTIWAKAWNMIADIFFNILWKIIFPTCKLIYTIPFIRNWSSSDLENLQQLVLFIFSREQRSLGDYFCKNTSYWPNIDRSVVILWSHQNIWCSIPKSDHLMSEVFDWDTKSSSKTKISKLKDVFSIDKQILRLKISV